MLPRHNRFQASRWVDRTRRGGQPDHRSPPARPARRATGPATADPCHLALAE